MERSHQIERNLVVFALRVDVVQRAVFHPVRERSIDGAIFQRHKKYYLIVGGSGPLGRRRLIIVDHAAGGRLVLGHRSLRRLWGHDDGDVRRLRLLFLRIVCGVAVVLAPNYTVPGTRWECGPKSGSSTASVMPIASVAISSVAIAYARVSLLPLTVAPAAPRTSSVVSQTGK